MGLFPRHCLVLVAQKEREGGSKGKGRKEGRGGGRGERIEEGRKHLSNRVSQYSPAPVVKMMPMLGRGGLS